MGRHLPKFSSITEVLGSTQSMAQINQLEMKMNDPFLSTWSLWGQSPLLKDLSGPLLCNRLPATSLVWCERGHGSCYVNFETPGNSRCLMTAASGQKVERALTIALICLISPGWRESESGGDTLCPQGQMSTAEATPLTTTLSPDGHLLHPAED